MRAQGMGGADLAIATTNDAVWSNLAGMAQIKKYELDGSFAWAPDVAMQRYIASIVDSETSSVATGLGYSHISAHGASGKLSGSETVLGFAYSFYSVQLGAGLKYLTFHQNSPHEVTGGFTMDTGLLIHAGDWVKLGAVGYNLIDIGSTQAPRQIGGGISVGKESSFHVALDAVSDLSRHGNPLTVHSGAELIIGDVAAVRAGFEHDVPPPGFAPPNRVTAGAALLAQEVALEVAFTQNITPGQTDDRLLGIGIKLFL